MHPESDKVQSVTRQKIDRVDFSQSVQHLGLSLGTSNKTIYNNVCMQCRLISQNLPQHDEEVVLELVNLLDMRLRGLPGGPAQAILSLGASSPLGLDRVQLVLLLGVELLVRSVVVRHVLEVLPVQTKVGRLEARRNHARVGVALGSKLLSCLVRVPPLPGLLPGNERVDLRNRLLLVHSAAEAPLKERIDVEGSVVGAVAEEFEDAFDPSHELREQSVVVHVHLVDKLVKVVLVPLAQVNERLDGLVRVSRSILLPALVNDL